MPDTPVRPQGQLLPEGAARWSLSHKRTGDGETFVVISFYDADSNLISRDEY